MAEKKHIGQNVDDYLAEAGDLERATEVATKRVLAWQLAEAMKREQVSEAELARRMNASRTTVRRLLDPESEAATLTTLSRAALALGRDLRVQLVKRSRRARPAPKSKRPILRGGGPPPVGRGMS